MGKGPEVIIIIPHWKGEAILRRCLQSLQKTDYEHFEILVVNNNCPDGSIDKIRYAFPDVQILDSEKNLGYAGGCNLGIKNTSSPFVVLLNNDTEVTPKWLSRMMSTILKEETVAAVQPKMLSIQNRKRFDYCGAAGGELDIFGYPFARGRLFDSMEEDRGQYDASEDIFWATGAATLLRREAVNRVGLLDETFFAHMEEIDLDWRLHWAGYRVVAVPQAVVYHQTGATLGGESLRKMVLNHRNNLVMLLKNHTTQTLLWLFPLRLFLELMTMIAMLLMGRPKRSLAVILGFWGVLQNASHISNSRKKAAAVRSIPESVMVKKFYKGSIALEYFIKGTRRSSQLVDSK